MLITAPFRNENESILFYETRPEQQEGHPFFTIQQRMLKPRDEAAENLNGQNCQKAFQRLTCGIYQTCIYLIDKRAGFSIIQSLC
mgnify:CR=1 FL=1